MSDKCVITKMSDVYVHASTAYSWNSHLFPVSVWAGDESGTPLYLSDCNQRWQVNCPETIPTRTGKQVTHRYLLIMKTISDYNLVLFTAFQYCTQNLLQRLLHRPCHITQCTNPCYIYQYLINISGGAIKLHQVLECN